MSQYDDTTMLDEDNDGLQGQADREPGGIAVGQELDEQCVLVPDDEDQLTITQLSPQTSQSWRNAAFSQSA